MTSLPRVSVIMSVLNGEAFLRPAVESILGQTFRDFEFIVIDNASSDGTAGILDGYRDDRIVRLRNDDIRTLTQSLNRGLHAARGEYVARLDADDLAASERLGRQVAFLDANPDVVLVASHLRIIDETDRVIGHFRSPSEEAALYDDLAYRNPIGHSAAMFRRAPVLALGGYPPAYVFAQDLALWVMLAQRHARFAQPADNAVPCHGAAPTPRVDRNFRNRVAVAAPVGRGSTSWKDQSCSLALSVGRGADAVR